MPVGQVILGVRDLDRAGADLEAKGLAVVDGGVHPGLGTANRVVPLGHAYLELLCVVDEAVASQHAYGQSLMQRVATGDRLVRWSIRTEHIDDVAAGLGLEPEHRQRIRPDGSLLTWQAAGLELSLQDAWLPFFMQWQTEADFPGSTPVAHPVGRCSLAWIELATPDPQRLARWTEGQGELPLRRVAGTPGIHAAAIATPAGELVIRP